MASPANGAASAGILLPFHAIGASGAPPMNVWYGVVRTGDASAMVVVTSRFSGRVFWVALGATSGRGRLDRHRRRAGEAPKTVLVHPVVRNAKRRLRES